MNQKRSFHRLSAAVAAVVLTAGTPAIAAAPGDTGGSDTGDVFADLVIALRDANGVPVLQPFEVAGELGPTTEYCVQPVSYTLLPGMTEADAVINGADGRTVYPIPLMGELPPPGPDEDAVEACDPQPAYAMYVAEAELERLNMARQPDSVKQRKLEEVQIRLASADVIGLDGAGRITTDGVAIDAAPDHAAMFASLMATGTIPGLGGSIPAQVSILDAWELAAVAVGTASGKTVPLSIDSIEYYNRIMEVPANYEPGPDWIVDFWRTAPPGDERFVNFSGFSYTRADIFQGCATWLDVPTLTWMVSPIDDVVDFAPLPPVAYDTDDDEVADTVDNVAGFTQLADDVRAVISYLHENEVIPGFFLDPVGTNSCDAQLAALTEPAVQWTDVPADVIQTDVVSVGASVFMPWLGTTVPDARLRVTIEATDPGQAFTDGAQITALATDGPLVGESVTFEVVDDDLVGWFGPDEGFLLEPGSMMSTTFDVTVAAGAPIGTYVAELELVDLGDPDVVMATDTATTFVSDAALTVLWTSDVDFASQGTYVPVSVRIFNPDLGQDPLVDAMLQFTIHAPEPFALATQVAAWSDSESMVFTLNGDGDLIGTWLLDSPLSVPYDETITWYLNIAEGAPLGLYEITVDVIDTTPTVLSTDVLEITIAPASSHGGSGGGDDGGGDDDGTLPPVASITDGPSRVTSDADATFEFTADQDGSDFICSLDGSVPTLCTSPMLYTGLADGEHLFALQAAGGDGTDGAIGPATTWAWFIDTVDPTIEILTGPPAMTLATDATFTFAATGEATTICALDANPLIRCASPVSYTGLDKGVHWFTVAAVDAAGNHAVATHLWTITSPTPPPEMTSFDMIEPTRLADSRTDGTLTESTGPVQAGSVWEVQIAGRAGVPLDATAVVVNVTAVRPVSDGYLTVFPCGDRPVTSSLNYRAGQVVGNEIIAELSPDGTICVFTLSTTDIVIDGVGYVPADTDYAPVTPERLANTRVGAITPDGQFTGAGQIPGGTMLEVQIAGRADVPMDATAVVVNVTAVNPKSDGYLTVFPCGDRPVTSSLNYRAGQVVGNELVAELSPDGTICVFTLATTDIVVDVAGVLGTDYTPVDPERLADTRVGATTPDGRFTGVGQIPGGAMVEVQVAGRAGVPLNATAVVVNVTAVNPKSDGYLTVFPCGDRPVTSSLNYRAGQVVGNELVVELSPTGSICVFTLSTTDIVIDVAGHF